MTRDELAAHIAWEGSLSDFILGHGIGPEDLPEDVPADVRYSWKRLYECRYDLDLVREWLERG
jgi:hypothetical protein